MRGRSPTTLPPTRVACMLPAEPVCGASFGTRSPWPKCAPLVRRQHPHGAENHPPENARGVGLGPSRPPPLFKRARARSSKLKLPSLSLCAQPAWCRSPHPRLDSTHRSRDLIDSRPLIFTRSHQYRTGPLVPLVSRTASTRVACVCLPCNSGFVMRDSDGL